MTAQKKATNTVGKGPTPAETPSSQWWKSRASLSEHAC
jgi:hypothetical protein